MQGQAHLSWGLQNFAISLTKFTTSYFGLTVELVHDLHLESLAPGMSCAAEYDQRMQKMPLHNT